MYPFERFSESAKRVLTFSQEEAERAHHSYIGTEHLTLGLLRVTDGLAARVLNGLGVEIEKVRSTIESVLFHEERIVIHQITPTSRVKKVIEISFEEAHRMSNNHVGTEHLLLALLVEGEGVGAHVLRDLGATLDAVRAELDRVGPEDSHTEEGAYSPPLPLSDEAMRILAGAGAAARRCGRVSVGPEHVLYALLDDRDWTTLHLLENLDAVDALRVALAALLFDPDA